MEQKVTRITSECWLNSKPLTIDTMEVGWVGGEMWVKHSIKNKQMKKTNVTGKICGDLRKTSSWLSWPRQSHPSRSAGKVCWGRRLPPASRSSPPPSPPAPACPSPSHASWMLGTWWPPPCLLEREMGIKTGIHVIRWPADTDWWPPAPACPNPMHELAQLSVQLGFQSLPVTLLWV